MKYFIDFSHIHTHEALYTRLAKELRFPEYFGANQDALWDCITGDLSLPAIVHFIDITPEQVAQFADVIAILREAEEELAPEFELSIFERTNNEEADAAG